MKLRRNLLLLGCVAGAATTAQAEALDSDRSTAFARKIASCVVRDSSDVATKWLLKPSAERENPTGVPVVRLLWQVCFNFADRPGKTDTMRVKPRVMEGFLAEALLRRTARRELPALPPKVNYAADWIATTPSDRAMDEMGLCVAEQAPKLAADVIWAPFGGKKEQAAIEAIRPMVSSCLDRNVELRTDALSMWLAIAVAYFHRLQLEPNAKVASIVLPSFKIRLSNASA